MQTDWLAGVCLAFRSLGFCCVSMFPDIDMMAQTHGQLRLVKESNCGATRPFLSLEKH